LGTAGCKNDEPEVELEPVMTLYDKPLSSIQKCILGKWKLRLPVLAQILLLNRSASQWKF
jgi:hypothetical protein